MGIKSRIINLPDSRMVFSKYNKHGEKEELQKCLRPETPGSELWIEITASDEFKEIFRSVHHNKYANNLSRYYAFVHYSDISFSTRGIYKKLRSAIVEHYADDLNWFKMLQRLDLKLSEINEMSIYVVIQLIEDELRELITFDFKTEEISYEKIELKDISYYKSLSKEQLKEQCRIHGLNNIGDKDDILKRFEKLISNPKVEKSFDGLSKDELVALAKSKNIPHSGTKEELRTRLTF